MLCKGGKGVLFTFAVQKATPPRKRVRSTAQARTGLRMPRPRHRHAHARRAAPCTRAHGSRLRSTRTLHACAVHHHRTCSLTATRACTSKCIGGARVTGHWLAVGLPCAGIASTRTSTATALHRPLRASLAHRAQTLCILQHATLPPCTDMMMTTEMILNETKKETMETMGDASECVPPAPATLMRQNARASTPPRASQAPEQNNTLQTPRHTCHARDRHRERFPPAAGSR